MADNDERTSIEEHFSGAIQDVNVTLSVYLGSATLRIHQMLKLGRGAVVELDQKISDPVEVYANDILVARGDVIVTKDDKIGVTLTEMTHSNASTKTLVKGL